MEEALIFQRIMVKDYKEINAVITNNQTGANKVLLKKFSHRNNDYYTLGSED